MTTENIPTHVSTARKWAASIAPLAFSLFVFAIVGATVALDPAAALAWSSGRWVMVLVIVPMIAALVGFLVGTSLVPETLVNKVGLGMSAGVFLTVALGVGAQTTDFVESSRLASAAFHRLEQGHAVLNDNPVIAREVARVTGSVALIQKNRDFLASVGTAKFGTEPVLVHLAAAKALGVDPVFVRNNGIVRAEDERVLLEAALRQSAQGNAAAAAWATTLAQR